MRLKYIFSIIAILLIVFIAGCEKNVDTGGMPTVTSTTPANLATEVAINRIIVVEFSEPMDMSTITDLTFTVMQGATAVTGVVAYSGTSATFTPSANLSMSQTYIGTITTGVKNEDGIAMGSNHTFSFSTGALSDNTLPTVTSKSPIANATAVARDKVVSISFSESMNPETIDNLSLTLKQGTTIIPGAVGYSGTTATFTTTNVLSAETVYTVTISTGAEDLAGNALVSSTEWSFTTNSSLSDLAVINLGTASNFAILAKTKISTTGTTHVTGNIGISPAAATFITGFALTLPAGGVFSTSALVTGNIYAPGYASPTPSNMTTAISNMETAYTDAAGRTLPDFTELYAGNIGGKTLVSGLYNWTSTVIAPTSFTISGSATDIWIFQISKNLTVSNGVNVILGGEALAKNIFWQVAGTATLGTTSHFEGNIMSKTGITFNTGASMNGRALAQTAVVLDANAITKPL